MADAETLRCALRKIRAIALDVDGVLTDGGMWWGESGEEFKRFSFADIMGVSLARRMGLRLALISGEDSALVDRYAAKMRIDHVVKGCRDKAKALREFARKNELAPEQVCFMGDDVNDLEAMRVAGVSAAPFDAQPAVLAEADFCAARAGGHGAVRDLVEALLGARDVNAETLWRGTDQERGIDG